MMLTNQTENSVRLPIPRNLGKYNLPISCSYNFPKLSGNWASSFILRMLVQLPAIFASYRKRTAVFNGKPYRVFCWSTGYSGQISGVQQHLACALFPLLYRMRGNDQSSENKFLRSTWIMTNECTECLGGRLIEVSAEPLENIYVYFKFALWPYYPRANKNKVQNCNIIEV